MSESVAPETDSLGPWKWFSVKSVINADADIVNRNTLTKI